MKQYLLNLLMPFTMLLSTTGAHAQNVIITYAGTPQSIGYSGDGALATDAQLNSPSDVVVDAAGNLFIADFINNVIRKVDTFGLITTFAGTGFGSGTAGAGGYSGDNGPATAAKLNGPYALAFDASGNLIFADGYNHRVRMVSPAGIITTFAGGAIAGYTGNGGPATAAELNNPVGIAIDKIGNVYIADDHNNVIRKVDPTGMITTIAGNTVAGHTGDGGPATAAELSLPIGIAIDTSGNLFIADAGNNVIRKVTTAGIISTYAGTGAKGYSGDGALAVNAKLDTAQRVDFDNLNNLYISDGHNNVIRMVNASGIINTVVGSGFGADSNLCFFGGEDSAALNSAMCLPQGVAFDHAHRMYIADRGNSIIRRVGPAVVADHTGINALTGTSSSVFSVYPNPANSGIFTATLTTNTTEEEQVTITNILGEKVYSQTTISNKPLLVKLNVPSGIYFLSANTVHGKWGRQITIEK